ncbi:MAG: ATP-binding cassette domain-containing protein, partial [Eubacteriales bacterium]
MSLISASDISKSFVMQEIFRDVSFRIEPGDKIGIVGVNGAGKTTLFRVLTGEEDCDSGEIFRDRGASMAYMRQHSDYTSQKTPVEEVTEVFADLETLEKDLADADASVAVAPTEQNLARQQRLREEFQAKDGLTFRARVRSTLLGLGFDENELSLPLEKLSGGQRTRVLLAKILLSGADLILLDEPTNHLDIASTRWLEDFLSSYRGAVAVISHDRYFLDRVCTRIFELENKKLTCYKG